MSLLDWLYALASGGWDHHGDVDNFITFGGYDTTDG